MEGCLRELKLNVVEFIRQVRDGESLDPAQIRAFVTGVAQGHVPDYQASAYLMAVYHQGLEDDAVVETTLAMRDSGKPINLSQSTQLKSISTLPVVLAIRPDPAGPLGGQLWCTGTYDQWQRFGAYGGHFDKLESIPGFDVFMGRSFCRLVEDEGLCMMGATSDVAPADKKFYALRDVTSTVESIPLITASILSKKLSEGIDALVLDVKFGAGAFMKDFSRAEALAESLVRVGQGAGLKVRALLTNMNAPLGRTIGNSLEIVESIEILQGRGPADTTELTREIAAEMVVLGGRAGDLDQARALLDEQLSSGAALEKFKAMVRVQGGDTRVIDDPSLLPQADEQVEVYAESDGWVAGIDALGLGTLAMDLGAGRRRAEDAVDHAVGIELDVRIGSEVKKGDRLGVIHQRRTNRAETRRFYDSFSWSDVSVSASELIERRI